MKEHSTRGYLVATLALALLALAYVAAHRATATQGLLGSYRTLEGEGVHSRVDGELLFHSDRRLRSVFTNHWDIDRLGFPHQFPPYRVLWTGFLTVPSPPAVEVSGDPPEPSRLAIDTSADVEVRIGDHVALSTHAGESPLSFSTPLEPGSYPIIIDLANRDPHRAFHFRAGWVGADGDLQPLPADAFTIGNARSPGRRIVNSLGAAFVVVLALSVYLSPRWRRVVDAYRVWLWGHRRRVAVGSIVVLATALRFHDYDVVPLFVETKDEFKTGWIGWTLIHEGVPSGWSLEPPSAETYEETWFGHHFVIAKIKLHPPPLFPLLTGLASLWAGVDQMFEVSLSIIRVPAVLCSIAATFLVYLLAFRCYGGRIAVLASLLYATLPNAAVSARLAKEENLLAVLALTAVLALWRYLDGGRASWLYLSIVAAGLATLTKEIGIYVGGVVFLMLAHERRWGEIVRTLPLFLGLYALYFLYCWWYASDPVAVVGGVDAASAMSFWTVFRFFTLGRIVNIDFGSGWTIWLSLSLMTGAVRKNWAIVGPIVTYLLLMAVVLGENFDYGWYRIPLYPFLCIAGAVFISELIEEADIFRATLFLLLAVVPVLRYVSDNPLADSAWGLRWILAFALLPFVVHFAFPGSGAQRWARAFAVGLFAVHVLGCIWIVVRFLHVYVGN